MAHLTNPLLRVLYVVLILPLHLTLPILRQLILGIVPAGRQDPKWTLRQAVAVRAVRSVLRVSSILQRPLKLSLNPGKEGDRFTVVVPSDDTLYAGPLSDAEVRPSSLGGTWTPSVPPSPRGDKSLRVALHFHGGAYVIGDGRDSDTGFTADVLRRDAGFTHVFTPQYRLAQDRKTRFPAQLQDALSSYLHLTRKLGIPAENIIVGGDSAGGNLAIGLLRYIHDYGAQLDIPSPKAAMLWSPWTDLSKTHDPAHVASSPNFTTDYLDPGFAVWGTERFTGYSKIDASGPYLSPAINEGFDTGIPIWVHTGGREMLFPDNEAFVKTFKDAGNNVEWYIDDLLPHDMVLIGKILGFDKEVRAAAQSARKFIQ